MEILIVHIPLHFILINIGIFTIGNIFYLDFLSYIVIMDISFSAITKCSQKHRLLNFAYKNMDIKRLKPATPLCVSQARTWISNVICRGLFFFNVQWVEVRGDCLFCWSWSCWSSLFKRSFHNCPIFFITIKYALPPVIQVLPSLSGIFLLYTLYKECLLSGDVLVSTPGFMSNSLPFKLIDPNCN